ncbi:hypothetical protein BK133_11280 [Paenibacillus sp. FSL H8-0548]|uniref:hypothetical protein n=1 Tax=Paenibacillus sp. FSL H8-0548 TaxID=1920422 RepID=UPI00096CF780|nr:hypothetical protein [Paenibacillus sp. FSL H8-0548]OMF35278.1 hypothetical protein BK133_11280 [Paenibacillus sp. FSL H8-0548]
MKHSIRGAINTVDGALIIIAEINKYQLWRLVTADSMDNDGNDAFTFEAWVNVEADKVALFDGLKPFVDTWGGWIDWHECSHDEATTHPCVISETYTGG